MDTYTGLMFGIILIIAFWGATDPRPYRERINYFLKTKRLIFWFVFMAVFYLQYLIYYYYPEYHLTVWPFVSILGIIIFIAGTLLGFWAKITMKGSWGVSGEHNIERQNKLVKSGPFKYSRNPIYVGLFFVLLGFFLALNSPLVFFMLPLAVIINNSVRKEEELLINHFKDDYLNYMKKVHRYL